jgi:hypothetical protein
MGSNPPVANPNDVDLFAGIAGAELNIDQFELGHAVTISKTFSHIFAPFLIAFDRPRPPWDFHPPPWKAVSGGLGFDIEAELYVPKDLAVPDWFDRLNTVWWLLALLRLRATPLALCPVIASVSFGAAASENTEFWPVEIRSHRLIPEPNPRKAIDEDELVWVRDHWVAGGRLFYANPALNVAFQAFDQCHWTPDASLALVALWGALERLFSPSHNELRFRVPATIAAYLKPPGAERHELFTQVKRLYDARSEAAHGGRSRDKKALAETYALARRVLIAILEAAHVPSREELEARVFGA